MKVNSLGKFNSWVDNVTTFTHTGAIDLDILIQSPQLYAAGGGDTTAPTISVRANVMSFDDVVPTVTTDEGNGNAYMVIVLGTDSAPSIAQVKAGQNQGGTAALASETLGIVTGGLNLFTSVTTLSASTTYDIYIVHTDAATNDSTLEAHEFTTQAEDVVLPVLTNPLANSVTETTVIPSVVTDKSGGALYMVLVYNPNAIPTASQIIAGTNGNGTAVPNENITPVLGTNTFTQLTELLSGATYSLYFVHVDDLSNESLVSSISFTTVASLVTLSGSSSSVPYGVGVTPIVTAISGIGTTIYMVIVPDGDVPSADQIKNGLQSDDTAALGSESYEVNGNSVVAFTPVSGLDKETAYEVAFVAENANGVESNIETSGFTTVFVYVTVDSVRTAVDDLVQENTIDIYSREPHGEDHYTYYCVGNVTPYSGKAMWIKVVLGDIAQYHAGQIVDVMLQDGNTDPNIL